jgi:hypothetical protein
LPGEPSRPAQTGSAAAFMGPDAGPGGERPRSAADARELMVNGKEPVLFDLPRVAAIIRLAGLFAHQKQFLAGASFL